MKILNIFLLALLIENIALNLVAAPKDISVAAYENFKKQAEAEIDKVIAAEFKSKEESVKRLAVPFKTGEQITISLVQGERQRVVTGKFIGLKGQYAEIDERSILLSDIEEIDQQRLLFADQVALLQLKLNQMSKNIEEEKAHRKEVLLEAKYKQAGYSKKFFENTIQLADKFWEMEALGDQAITLQVVADTSNELIRMEIANSYAEPLSLVLIHDKKPIYAEIAKSSGTDAAGAPVKGSKTIFLFKSELGADFFAGLEPNLRLWVVKPDVGSWYLRPVAEGKAQTVKIDKTLCQECFGSKTSVITHVDESGAAPTETIPCPTCQGKGTVAGNDEQTLEKFRFRIIKSTIKNYSQANLRDLAKYDQEVQALKERVEAHVNETKTKVRQAREEWEKANQAQIEQLKQEAAAKEKGEMLAAQIEQNFIWVTAATAVRRNAESLSNDKVKSTHDLDNYDFPTTCNEQPVLQFTDWTKITPKTRELSGQKFRLLKVAGNGGAAAFLLQYHFAFVNSNDSLSDFNTDVAVKFANGEEERWSDTFTRILPSWSGSCFGAHELPPEKLSNAIDSVTIEPKK